MDRADEEGEKGKVGKVKGEGRGLLGSQMVQLLGAMISLMRFVWLTAVKSKSGRRAG